MTITTARSGDSGLSRSPPRSAGETRGRTTSPGQPASALTAGKINRDPEIASTIENPLLTALIDNHASGRAAVRPPTVPAPRQASGSMFGLVLATLDRAVRGPCSIGAHRAAWDQRRCDDTCGSAEPLEGPASRV